MSGRCPYCSAEMLKRNVPRHIDLHCQAKGDAEEVVSCRAVSLDHPPMPPDTAAEFCRHEPMVTMELDAPPTAELEEVVAEVLKKKKHFTEEGLLDFAMQRLPTLSDGAVRCLVVGAVTGARMASGYHHFWRDNVRGAQQRDRQGAAAVAGDLARWALGFHEDFVSSPRAEDSKDNGVPLAMLAVKTTAAVPTASSTAVGKTKGQGVNLDGFPVSYERAAQQLEQEELYQGDQEAVVGATSSAAVLYSPFSSEKTPVSGTMAYSPTRPGLLEGAAKIRALYTKKKKAQSPSPVDVEPESGPDHDRRSSSTATGREEQTPARQRSTTDMPTLVEDNRTVMPATEGELSIDLHAPPDNEILPPEDDRASKEVKAQVKGQVKEGQRGKADHRRSESSSSREEGVSKKGRHHRPTEPHRGERYSQDDRHRSSYQHGRGSFRRPFQYRRF